MLIERAVPDWPDAGLGQPWAGVQGNTGIENTSASPQVSLVFSIPVFPSPREARTGQADRHRYIFSSLRSRREIGFETTSNH